MREVVLDYETKSVDRDPGWWNPRNRILLEGWYIPDTDIVIQFSSFSHRKTYPNDPGEAILIIGHNLSFDLGWHMRASSLTKEAYLKWFRSPNVQLWDTQLVEYILQGQNVTRQSLRLKDLCVRYGIAQKDWSVDWRLDISEQELKEYNELDLRYTYALYQHQLKSIPSSMLSFIASQMQMQKCTIAASIRGMDFNYTHAAAAREAMVVKLKDLDIELTRIMTSLGKMHALEWNPSSAQDIGILLFGGSKKFTYHETILNPDGTAVVYKSGVKKGEKKMVKKTSEWKAEGIFPGSGRKTAAGNWIVDEETLKGFAGNDFVDKLLEYRNLSKEVNTYFQSMIKFSDSFDGCIHPQYNHTVTVTGRLSSSNPNLQNIKGE